MFNRELNSLVVSYIIWFILLSVAVINGGVGTNGEDSGDFRLTKLLNIEVGAEPRKLMDGDVRNTISAELRRGLAHELRSSFEPLEPVSSPIGSYNRGEQLITDLKELYSEVFSLKKNLSDILDNSSGECFIQSDIMDGKSYPIGVSFHRLCHPKKINREVAQTKKTFPRSCKEVQEQGNNASGLYQIQPKRSEKPFMVLCDMESKGGGWTHIQKRYDGSVDFYLGWREYKFGFGDLETEFWIGLENIYKMTAFEVNELLVEIVSREGKTAYAHYKAFGIGAEAEGYPLHTLKNFSGDAGDSLAYHLGSKFTTKDFDQDADASNCAEKYKGAWWYKNCHYSNLNGKYINVDLPKQYEYQGMHWAGFISHQYSHAKSRMIIRPVG